MGTESFAPAALQENEELIVNWLQQNAAPVQRIEAGRGFSDLEPLKTLLRDVKVVGLGENTHGTREFCQLKHRLVEFLVVEMGFTTLAIEGSFAGFQPINDYVLYGKGDRATVLTSQGYVVWDTDEISNMMDWMRDYNQSVPYERKVKFCGVDLWGNEIGRRAVLAYLRQTDPDRLKATETLFELLAKAEVKWPRRVDDETKQTMVQALPQLQDLIDYLTETKARPDSQASGDELARALRYTLVMKQWLTVNAADLLPKADMNVRSVYMAGNLIDLIEQAGPEDKFIIWQHNVHVSVGGLWEGEPNLGHTLREKYGRGYFVFGFEFGEGSFQSRTVLPDKHLGDLKEITLPAPPSGSLPWYLSRTDMGVLILNLSAPTGQGEVERWLQAPQTVHNIGWVYDESSYHNKWSVAKKYDGLIYVDRTTATRPTVNALRTVARREGL
jgi:erythromycin esterase